MSSSRHAECCVRATVAAIARHFATGMRVAKTTGMRRILLSLSLSVAACSAPSSEPEDAELARPPARPERVASTGDVRWFVIDSFDLGATDGWKRFGYDLDGRATSVEDSRNGVGACVRKPGAPNTVLADGDKGIDNNVGRYIVSTFKSLMPELETETNARIARGRYTVVLRLENVGPDDNGHVPGALWLVGEREAPSFTPDEKWPVAAKTMWPLQIFPSGYMRGGVWVSTDSTDARASVPVPVLGDALVFPLRRAVVSVRVADGKSGVIAGAIRTSDLTATLAPSLVRRGICPGNATHEQFLRTFGDSADLRLDGGAGECDAVSAGIGFTMKPIAGLEGITGEPPPPQPHELCIKEST